MEDIKILQEELRTSRSKTRSTRLKGFNSKSCRPIIRFKLVDLDFSLKLGDIQDIKTRPLFFSIINDSGATSRRNSRQICDFLSKANYMNTVEIGDGDNRVIPRDLKTKMIGGTVAGRSSERTRQKAHDEIKYGDGDNKTYPRDLETRMPRTLRSLVVGTLSRNLLPGYATTRMPRTLRSHAVKTLSKNLLPGYARTKMPGRAVAASFTPCTLRSSAAEILYRNLIPGDETAKRQKIQGETVSTNFTPRTLRSSAAGTLYRILNVVRHNGNQGIVDRKIYETRTYQNGAISMVDKMKVENVMSATQVQPTSNGTIPEIDISDIRHRCQDTKDIFSVNTLNSSTVSSAMTEHRHFSDKTEEQETPKPKKRQNFLKKFWKRITRKSKNKAESKIDEEKVKTLKKSSMLTSLICLCQPKTMD